MRKFIRNAILDIFLNATALALVVYWLDQVYFSTDIISLKDQIRILVLAGLFIGILNVILKPILRMITFPLIVISLGIFYFFINAFLLYLTTLLVPEIIITGFWTYIWASIIFSIINTIESWLFKYE